MGKSRKPNAQRNREFDAPRRPFDRSRATELDREYRRFRAGVEKLLNKRVPFPFQLNDTPDNDSER